MAGELLDAGVARLPPEYTEAWLAVVATNTRARRFYERAGWRDCGPFLDPVPTSDGVIDVPAHHFVRQR